MDRLEALGASDGDDKLAALVEHVAQEVPFPDLFDPERAAAGAAFVQWAEAHPCLKAVAGTLPQRIGQGAWGGDAGSAGAGGIDLVDVRVQPPRKGPRTDDAVYEADAEVRARVARGNCFARLRSDPSRAVCCVQSLRKFTGGSGDDDDKTDEAELDDLAWKKFFLKPLEESKAFISCEKANGEAAHLAVLRLEDGSFMLFPGSKNVHIAIQTAADIELYSSDRFRVAREVAQVVMSVVEGLGDAKRMQLFHFLAKLRLTATFELLQPSYQHVELLGPKPELKFIAWTATDLKPMTSLSSINPAVGLRLARHFGLDTVAFQLYPAAQLEERVAAVRATHGKEGDVLYFLDAEENVIGLLKKKTVWYVCLRAIREKIRGAVARLVKNPDTSVPNLKKSTEARLQARFVDIKGWLKLGDEDMAKWANLYTAFSRWTIDGVAGKSLDPEELAKRFPVVWRDFLAATGNDDH